MTETEPMTGPGPLPVPLLDPTRVFARRIARIASGVVLQAGMLALVAAAVSGSFRAQPSPLNAAQIIGYTWFAAAVVGAAAYPIAAALQLRLRPEALFVPSLTIPVAGVALILPLTLHLLFFALTSGLRFDQLDHGFNDWVQVSLVVTGAAHVVFAALCATRVHELAAGDAAMASPMTPPRIFRITVAVSCFPFVLMFGVPPVLVAITGLPILPLLYGMQRVVARERRELAMLPAQPPRATAILRRRG